MANGKLIILMVKLNLKKKYDNGVNIGEWKTYYENGSLKWKGIYKSGELIAEQFMILL